MFAVLSERHVYMLRQTRTLPDVPATIITIIIIIAATSNKGYVSFGHFSVPSNDMFRLASEKRHSSEELKLHDSIFKT